MDKVLLDLAEKFKETNKIAELVGCSEKNTDILEKAIDSFITKVLGKTPARIFMVKLLQICYKVDSNYLTKKHTYDLLYLIYLSQEDILTTIQRDFVGVVRDLFTWVEGFFRFDNNRLPSEDKIRIRLDLENLIIEGSRQLREWEQLQDEIPSLEMALKFADRPGANLKNVNLSVEEWRVVSYITPKNKISQIARTTKMDDIEIRRIVYGLIQAGLVEITRPEGPKPKLARNMFPTQDKKEQRSLVNRLINRIRSI